MPYSAHASFPEVQLDADSGRWLLLFGENAGGEPGGLAHPGKGLPCILVADSSSGPTLQLCGEPDSLPAFARSSTLAAVFYGVLYNRRELERLLTDSASSAANDAEFLIRAYRRWGEDLPSMIKGIFAMVIWDAGKDLLMAVRDRIGFYPLFYAHEKILAISPSIEAIVQSSGLSVSLNRAALADHLSSYFPKKEETFYTEIQRVLPGHVLYRRRGMFKSRRYWHPVPPGRPVNWLSEDDLHDFETSLDQAVGRGLDQGPVGIYLSGGLDSVSVAAVAADLCRSRGLPQPLALSLAFPHPDCNEKAVQRRVATQLGLDQVLLPFHEALGGIDLLTAELAMSSGWPQPLDNPWLPAYVPLAAEARQRGVRTILTGSGGDEWLGVSPLLVADLMQSGDIVGLWRFWNIMRRSFNNPSAYLFRNIFWSCGLRPILAGAAHRLFSRMAPDFWQRYRLERIAKRRPSWLAPDRSLRQELHRRAAVALSDLPTRGFYQDLFNVGFAHPLVSREMEETFETGRRLGVKILHPYWDSDLVELLLRVPPSLLNRGGRSKGLVREMLFRRFPQLGFERQKKVIATNFYNDLIIYNCIEVWCKMGGAQALGKLGIIDAPYLDRAIKGILHAGDKRAVSLIKEVMVLEAWVRPRLK